MARLLALTVLLVLSLSRAAAAEEGTPAPEESPVEAARSLAPGLTRDALEACFIEAVKQLEWSEKERLRISADLETLRANEAVLRAQIQDELAALRKLIEAKDAEHAAEVARLRHIIMSTPQQPQTPTPPQRAQPQSPTLPVAPTQPAQPQASQWSVVEQTYIDGTVNKVELGTLFKTATGSLYRVTEPAIELALLLNPEVTVLSDGARYRLIIKGLDDEYDCERLDGIAANGTGSVIEDRIDQEFEGFSPGNLYTLRNGQIWEQVSARYRYRYKYAPRVTIWPSGTGHEMRVDGMDDTIQVRQVR